MKKYIISGSALLLTPSIVLAVSSNKGLEGVASRIGDLINTLVPIVISAAVLFFLFGLAKFMWSAGEDKEKGKDIMIWGTIALFVMVSIWGLVNLVGETVGVTGKDAGSFINTTNLIK